MKQFTKYGIILSAVLMCLMTELQQPVMAQTVEKKERCRQDILVVLSDSETESVGLVLKKGESGTTYINQPRIRWLCDEKNIEIFVGLDCNFDPDTRKTNCNLANPLRTL